MPVTAAQKRYRECHPERVAACCKKSWPAYYAREKEKYKERARQFRQQHPEEAKRQSREYAAHNRQTIIEKRRIWRKRNRAKIVEYMRTWRNANRERYSALQAKHRALKKGAQVNLQAIIAWMKQVRSKKTVRCYYCKQHVPVNAIHFDHIVPLSRGGMHSVENLCVTCAFCNLSKGDKPLRAWIRMGQQVLEL